MIVKTRIFEFSNRYYKNLSELATVMGISVSQIYRVREGKRQINQKFIVGAMKAFPNHKLDDLFFLTPEVPAVNKNNHNRHSQAGSTDRPDTGEQQVAQSPQQIVERFISATEEYEKHLKSHTSATINMRDASQEIKRGIDLTNKALIYLTNSQN
jgi:hypothetical protein